jgi:hypothetical protein
MNCGTVQSDELVCDGRDSMVRSPFKRRAHHNLCLNGITHATGRIFIAIWVWLQATKRSEFFWSNQYITSNQTER